MKKYAALSVAVIILGGSAFYTQQWFIESYATDVGKLPARSSTTFTASATGTVLDAMHAHASESTFSFSGRDFPGLGFFVEEIHGRRAADGYHWILYLNGAQSDLGVSQARVRPGDTIEWRYEQEY